jgi:hypothetical protein
MGKAEDSHAEARDFGIRSQKDCSSAESTLGEGEARITRAMNLGRRIRIQTGSEI